MWSSKSSVHTAIWLRWQNKKLSHAGFHAVTPSHRPLHLFPHLLHKHAILVFTKHPLSFLSQHLPVPQTNGLQKMFLSINIMNLCATMCCLRSAHSADEKKLYQQPKCNWCLTLLLWNSSLISLEIYSNSAKCCIFLQTSYFSKQLAATVCSSMKKSIFVWLNIHCGALRASNCSLSPLRFRCAC